MDAALLTETAQELRLHCEQLEGELREVKKQCNKLAHMLEHAVWEDDMIVEETIVFNGLTADFVELIGPLVISRKWKVNDRHEVKPFLRSLYSIFRICYDPEKDFLTLGALTNAVQNYLDIYDKTNQSE
ncbi:MAG: hypothetical protein ACK5N4_20405 [Parabacteroides gordonii]|uniref:hypothetical protein n=1 Tax=Parabacteroides gordonii TaxID=574930 RepID=UPI003A8BEA1D